MLFACRAVTEHYYVLLQNPTRLDVKKLLLEYMFGKVSFALFSILLEGNLPAAAQGTMLQRCLCVSEDKR